VSDAPPRLTHRDTLRDGQEALNVAFGAVLSAYIGNSLAEIDNRPFAHGLLAEFILCLAVFILGLCVGNAALLRGNYWFAAVLLLIGAAGGVVAHEVGRRLGFEVAILRILALCWVGSLLGSNVVLSLFVYLHHRLTGRSSG